jgi:hypothetical protein
MQYILKIYEKLLTVFKKPQIQKDIVNDEYIGSITFSLTKDNDIDIICMLPDITNFSNEKILGISEPFGKFLSYINDGYLIDDLFRTLAEQSQNAEDHDRKLLIDNILFFWMLFHVKNKEKDHEDKISGDPIIRPTEVFKQTNT